jgi:HSP20 family molecular chaperone IbpA
MSSRTRELTVASNDPRQWMWDEALDALARAERMHRQLFQPPVLAQARRPRWEPPIDVLETDHEVVIIAALPGVPEASLRVAIEGGVLVLAGERPQPKELQTGIIHRLELPQGQFERRIPLPTGRYAEARPCTENGCLIIRLRKVR